MITPRQTRPPEIEVQFLRWDKSQQKALYNLAKKSTKKSMKDGPKSRNRNPESTEPQVPFKNTVWNLL